jgi:hypothetical protein
MSIDQDIRNSGKAYKSTDKALFAVFPQVTT